MAQDSFGLEVTAPSSVCIGAISAYFEAALACRQLPEIPINQGESCLLALVLASDRLLASCGDAKGAAEVLRSCESDKDDATPREKQYFAAVGCWCDGDLTGCYDALMEIVSNSPADVFAVKRAQSIALTLGDSARTLAVADYNKPAGDSDFSSIQRLPRFLLGMLAFGLLQVGRYDEAEAAAKLELQGIPEAGESDIWLQLSLASAVHLQCEDGLEEAIELLQPLTTRWTRAELSPQVFSFAWGLLASLHCEQRVAELALDIFDNKLWSRDVELNSFPEVQLAALGVLWRLEARGQSEQTRPRWAKVLAVCRGTTLPEKCSPETKAPRQHADLLLDVFLARALCVEAAADAGSLNQFLESVAAHAAAIKIRGADRAETYAKTCRLVAELLRSDQPESGLPARQAHCRRELRDLQGRWPSLGGTEEQRCALLEAIEGPIVCGDPEKNYDKLFF